MDEKQKLAVLEKLVSFKSVNGHEYPVAVYLQSLLKQAGITSKIISLGNDRANLVAEIGSGKPVLGVVGHMDVVDVELDNWKTDPFKLTAKGDKLYGRGTTDMKGGLAAMVIAMMDLKEKKVPLNGTIRLLVTAGEEIGLPGSKKFYKDGYMKDVDTLIVGEPSGFRAPYASKGALNIYVKSVGKAAHSSMPKLGNNAVEHLINVLNKIKEKITSVMAERHNKDLGDTVFNIDAFHGGKQPNAIPGYAEAIVNVRTIPEFSNKEILQDVSDIIDDYNAHTNGHISYSVDNDIIPIVGDANSKILKLVQKLGAPYAKKYYASQNYSADELAEMKKAADLSGLKFATDKILPMGISGATDASELLIDHPVGCNYVMFGPGNDNEHGNNEYLSKTMYLEFIDLYEELFTKFFA